MRNLRSTFLLSLAASSMLTLTIPAIADTITVTILNSFQTIAPGQTVTFDATVTVAAGNANNYYLNSDTVNISDKGSILTADDSDFFSNFPVFLTPTGSGDTATGAAFTVTNTGQVTEAYTGTFTVFGGATDTATKKTAANFGSPVVAATPEPSSILLLSTGIVGLALMGRRRLVSTV